MISAWVSIFLFFLIFLFACYRTRSIVHPAVIVSGIWMILLILYNTAQDILYPLSEEFYYALCIWVVTFCAGALMPFGRCLKFGKFLTVSSPKTKLLKWLLRIFLVINCFGAYKYYSIGGGLAYSFMSTIKDSEDNLPLIFRILQYLHAISLVIYAVVVVNYDRLGRNGRFKFLFVAHVVSLFCWSFVLANKTGLVQFIIIGFIALYYRKKLKIRHCVDALCLGILGIFCMQILREKPTDSNQEFDTGKFILVYTLSPLTAFDMQLHHEISFFPNKTFRFFDNVGYKLGLIPQKRGPVDEWVEVPVPTNVYTVMHSFHSDFGYWGIFVFALILGVFWGILYMGIQFNIPFLATLYAVFAHSLILQFFADYIFTFLSVTLQVFIIVYFLFVKHKL